MKILSLYIYIYIFINARSKKALQKCPNRLSIGRFEKSDEITPNLFISYKFCWPYASSPANPGQLLIFFRPAYKLLYSLPTRWSKPLSWAGISSCHLSAVGSLSAKGGRIPMCALANTIGFDSFLAVLGDRRTQKVSGMWKTELRIISE